MDLADLVNHQATTHFDYLGHQVGITFYTQKLTGEYWAKLQSLGKEEQAEDGQAEALDADAKLLADFLVAWTVKNNSEPLTPTYENLQIVPKPLLAAAARAILEYQSSLGKSKKAPKD